MSISEEQVTNALKSVKYPGFTRDIVSFGLLKSVHINDGEVKVQLALATNDPNVPAAIKNDAEIALRGIKGVRSAIVLIDIHAPPTGAGADMGAMRIPGIKHVFAVASGKGGVGKSTVAANLAVALEQTGALACAIATFTVRAFRKCSVRASGQRPRKRTRSFRSSNTDCA
jgi:ATP-binding protein involved in chromosome partitioning